jgi:hypothetical protein
MMDINNRGGTWDGMSTADLLRTVITVTAAEVAVMTAMKVATKETCFANGT